MLTQRAAVTQFISGHVEISSDVATLLTSEQRKEVISQLCDGFKDGSIQLKDTPENKKKLENEAKLREYASGLLSDRLRKDKELNGGIKYQPKDPGKHAGRGNAQIKEMKKLQEIYIISAQDEDLDDESRADFADKAEILQEEITSELEKVATAKSVKTEPDYSKLNPDLLERLGITVEESEEEFEEDSEEEPEV